MDVKFCDLNWLIFFKQAAFTTYHFLTKQINIKMQPNLDYQDLDCPDFLIIRTFFSGPDFHRYVSDTHYNNDLQQNFFFSNYMMKLWCELNLFCCRFAPVLSEILFYVPQAQADYLDL